MIEKKKRRAIVRLVVSTIILSALVSILIVGIRSKKNPLPFFHFGLGNSYPHADEYTAGDTSIATERLDEINIDWISGKLQIELYEGDTIELREENSTSLTEEDKVHSYFHDGVLEIQFRRSELSLFHFSTPNKSLLIQVPKRFYSEQSAALNKLEIDNVSANIIVNDLPIRKCNIDTVSGDIIMNGAVDEWELDSVSGDSHLTSYTTPTDIETDTVSGNVTITVPSDSVFSTEHDSVSGDFTNAFPSTSKGGKNHWEFDSTSGDVTINCLDESSGHHYEEHTPYHSPQYYNKHHITHHE